MKEDLYEMLENLTPCKTFTRKLIGHIGIDSGLVWIGDPCYQRTDSDERKDYDEICQQMGDKMYRSFNYKMGHEGLGICSHNHIGDGTYAVYGFFEDDNQSPGQILIDFVNIYGADEVEH